MNFFCYPSVLGAKALIENHYWKYEFAMENVSMYSTFFNNAHVLLSLSKTDNVVCVYSSVKRYKLQSYQASRLSPNTAWEITSFRFGSTHETSRRLSRTTKTYLRRIR